MNRIYPFFWVAMALPLFYPVFLQGQSPTTYDFDTIRQVLERKQVKPSKLGLGFDKLMRFGRESKVAEQMKINDGYVQFHAIPKNGPDVLMQALVGVGARQCVKRSGMICGWYPIDRLGELEQMQGLQTIMAEFKPYRKVGETTSQGDVGMLSDLARLNAGVDGDGITIGILSDSYDARDGAAGGVASGDLPGPGNPNGYTIPVDILSEIIDPGSAIDEGRAMAELIHDVAPGAALKFYSAFNGYFDFADGILALREAGCDVIVDDIGYLAEPYFQDGTIAQAVTLVAEDGAVYFSAAGNSDRSSYEAPYRGNGENILGIGELHDFAPGDAFQRFVVEPGGFLNLWLQWDDASLLAIPPGESVYDGPAPESDYDMFLIDAITGDLVDFSVFDNIADLVPLEYVSYFNNTGQTVTLDLAISRFAGPEKYLKYLDFGDGIFPAEYNTFSGTCVGHSQAEGGFGVAASAYFNTPEFGVNPASVNFFSSAGGVPILLDTEGNPLPSPMVRNQPIVTGPDGTNTTFFPPGGFDLEGDGFPNFFGTSAAAPHVAALAALMLELDNGLTPSEIKKALIRTAADMDDPFTPGFDQGFDFATGHGFVQGDAALASLDAPNPYRFVLWDANANQPVTTIRPGDIFNEDELPISSTIQVLVAGKNAKKVTISLEGPVFAKRTERNAPYTLFGNEGSQFNGELLESGNYLVTAKVSNGGSLSVPFTVKGNDLGIAGLTLINAENDTPIGPLTDGAVIDADRFPGDLTVRALPESPVVKSVKIELDGPLSVNKKENNPPYTLFGNDGLDFFGKPFPAGSYTLTVTPYARRNLNGSRGTALSIVFTVESTQPLALRNEETGLDGELTESGESMRVYPSYGSGPFTVSLPKVAPFERLQLWMSDARGRILDLGNGQEDGSQQMIIDPQGMNLAPGMYFLHARTDEKEFPALKLIYQR